MDSAVALAMSWVSIAAVAKKAATMMATPVNASRAGLRSTPRR
ncbi:hypothetical protein [Kutzneria chonburiensis]|nr:hypothetical protein [Kutzneria chonburiensis]